MYVAASPHLDGESFAEISGMGSVYYIRLMGSKYSADIQLTGTAISKTNFYRLFHRAESVEVRQTHCAQPKGEIYT
jgi:hypothetical protein